MDNSDLLVAASVLKLAKRLYEDAKLKAENTHPYPEAFGDSRWKVRMNEWHKKNTVATFVPEAYAELKAVALQIEKIRTPSNRQNKT